jgi:hypothetical protein
MSEQLESALPVRTLGPMVSAPLIEGTERRPELRSTRPARKHSVVAAAFLLLYLAIYLAIGFLGISLLGRAWATFFG